MIPIGNICIGLFGVCGTRAPGIVAVVVVLFRVGNELLLSVSGHEARAWKTPIVPGPQVTRGKLLHARPR